MFVVRNSVASIIFLWISLLPSSISATRITVTNGVYDGILLAIHPDTDATSCLQLIRNISASDSDAFHYTSAELSLATGGRVRFGSLKILIPSTWGVTECIDLPHENVSSAQQFDLYRNADFKVSSNHSFGGKLPWTNQYKGCENESDFIDVPIEFFQNVHFDLKTRARLLLAEWAKFRYGVFEEQAYFSQTPDAPCYSIQGRMFLTPCSRNFKNGEGNRSSESNDNCDCKNLVRNNLEKLTMTDSSSLLLGSQLSTMASSCGKDFPILGVSSKKHYRLCERRNVSQVIFSHSDFAVSHETGGQSIFPNRRRQRPVSTREGTSLQISLVRQDQNLGQGYAFILEDDTNMRTFGRLKYVKQAIAQILQLTKRSTNVAVMRFEGSNYYMHSVTRIETELDRLQVLSKIPDLETSSLREYISARIPGRSNQIQFPVDSSKKKTPVLKMLEVLSGHHKDRWHLILITSSPPGDLVDALPQLTSSPHALSVVTFDGSKEWLKFNEVSNMNKILFLPSCSSPDLFKCYGKPSSLFVNMFTEILATNSTLDHHFTHHVVDFTFTGEEASFTISGENYVTGLENFQVFLPMHSAKSTARLISPSGKLCRATKLLNYGSVIQFDTSPNTGCSYEIGDWVIQVTESAPAGSIVYTLTGLGETAPTSDSNLLVKVSFGKSLIKEVLPTLMRNPIYVVVTTEVELPVINAEVTVEITHENQTRQPLQIILADNGVDPDLEANDGVYSACLTDFSPHPSFHSGSVTVKTIRGRTQSIRAPTFIPMLNVANRSSTCCTPFTSTNSLTDTSIGTAQYSILFPSFRTGERIDPDTDYAPPSRIQSLIKIVESATQDQITFQFIAPGENYSVGTVAHYDICCTNSTSENLDESLCIPLTETNGNICKPASSAATQYCSVSTAFLTKVYYNGSLPVSPVTLSCTIRGVDRTGNIGPLSFDSIELILKSEKELMSEKDATAGKDLKSDKDPISGKDALGKNESEVKCTGFSDGCLRIDVFWALIGCIGGLLLILFIVVVCWCCVTRQDRKRGKKKSRKLTKKNEWVDAIPQDSPTNVYTNRAYIQDANGQLKLVNSDGFSYPVDSTSESFDQRSNVHLVEDQRASVSRKLPAQMRSVHGSRHDDDSWNRRSEELPNTSSLGQIPVEHEHQATLKSFVPPRPTASGANRIGEKPQQLSVHYFGSHMSEQDIGSANSLTVDGKQGQGPVYATVFRHGRKVFSKTDEDSSHHPIPNVKVQDAPPIPQRSKTNTQDGSVTNSRSTIQSGGAGGISDFPTKYADSAKAVDANFNENQRNQPHVIRLDHFPSSESEAYSDMSHLKTSPVKRHPFVRSNAHDQKPRPASSPAGAISSNLGNADLTILEPHYRSMEIQRPSNIRNNAIMKPPVPPPVPPPAPPPRPMYRYDDVANEVPVFPSHPVVDTFADAENDDSDEWDNYDYDEDAGNVTFRIQYKPGTSYA